MIASELVPGGDESEKSIQDLSEVIKRACGIFKDEYSVIVDSSRFHGASNLQRVSETCFRLMFRAIMTWQPLKSWAADSLELIAGCVAQLQAEGSLGGDFGFVGHMAER